MDKVAIEERKGKLIEQLMLVQNNIEVLTNRRNEAVNAVQVLKGALQDCEYWLSQVNLPVEEDIGGKVIEVKK